MFAQPYEYTENTELYTYFEMWIFWYVNYSSIFKKLYTFSNVLKEYTHYKE